MRRAIVLAVISFLSCLFLAFAAGGDLDPDNWIYSDPAGFAGDIVVRAGSGRASIGHVATTARFCSKTSGMDCFQVSALHFAIPVEFSVQSIPKTWRHDGRTYSAVPSPRRLQLLGESMEIVAIEERSSSTPMRFLFSPQRGLVGIQAISGDTTAPIFLLQQRCGFSAPPTCYHAK